MSLQTIDPDRRLWLAATSTVGGIGLLATAVPFVSLWRSGFDCHCHGSKFDLAGRLFKNVPAPTNLVVPPYHFVFDSTVLIGVDSKA